MSRPVLFLDVDGVLNCRGTRERSPHRTLGVEPSKASLVRRIVAVTGARIVLSSTWRKYPDLVGYLWECLGPEPRERWAGSTPVLGGFRGEEIAAWLAANPGAGPIAILDDDSDMGDLIGHLVKTSSDIGLTAGLADEAIDRLRAAPENPRNSNG